MTVIINQDQYPDNNEEIEDLGSKMILACPGYWVTSNELLSLVGMGSGCKSVPIVLAFCVVASDRGIEVRNDDDPRELGQYRKLKK